ncbi:MAG: hypothetical protein WCQ47_02755 [bacterium]
MLKIMFLCFFNIVFVSSACSQNVVLNTEVEAKTKYVWRAIYVGSEPFVLQPSATLSASGFSFFIWANMNTDTSKITVNEINYTFSYIKKFGSFSFEPAFIYYSYPVGAPNSADVSMKLYYFINDSFTLYNTHYLSIMGRYGFQNNAYYTDLGLQYIRKLSEKFLVETSLSFALASSKFNFNNAGVEKGGLDNMIFNIQLPYYVTNNIYLRPRLTLSTLLMSSVRDALSPKQKTTNLIGCFSVGADI